jgi:predicted Zn-dependent protease
LELALTEAHGAGAEDVEVSFRGTETHFVRFARSRFTQVGTTSRDTLRIRALVDGRLGAQTCATREPLDVRLGARRLVEVARLAPRLDAPFRFTRPEDVAGRAAGAGAHGEVPAELTAAQAPLRLRGAFELARAQGVECAGVLKVHRHTLAVSTLSGVRRRCACTEVDARIIAVAGDGSGYAASHGPAARGVDFEALVLRASETALRTRDPVGVAAGRYDVVLAPEAIAELIEWMADVSFGALSVLDGTSCLIDRSGVQICDPAITVVDDRAGPDEPSFDAEGTTRREVRFIDAGRGGGPVTDRLTAARMPSGGASTGHARDVTGEGAGPAVAHLHLHPGDASEEDLIRAVGYGLYIPRFHYVNGLLDTRRTLMTGVTRDGAQLIEGGRLTRGVRNLRFTEVLLEALTRVGGLGRSPRDVAMAWSDQGTVTTPAVLLRGFNFGSGV